MSLRFDFERDFITRMNIGNAEARLAEAREVARRIKSEGVELNGNMDHTAIFSDPPRHVSGAIRPLGYLPAFDNRCYLSPVDNHELVLFVSKLPAETPLRAQGWFEHIAAVFAIDTPAYDHVVAQGQGNPFIHHMTMGIVPPIRGSSESEVAYALRVIPFAIETRERIMQGVGEQPGNLIISLPEAAFADRALRERLPELTHKLGDKYQVERMQGGGFLLQFFVLAGGRIEVAIRNGTTQAFNPSSVEKISTDEISVRQELMEQALAPNRR